MTLDDLADRLGASLGRPVRRDVPLSAYSTYRLGGPAAVLVEVVDDTELLAAAAALRECPAPILVVGNGSNLLVHDAGFAGLAIHLAGSFESVVVGDDLVEAGGGVALPVLARRCAAAGRKGVEFYVGIPGTVGGAVRMNAGGHGSETADVLVEAAVLDLGSAPDPHDRATREEVRRPGDLGFSYRRSNLTATHVVTRASFRVSPDDPVACGGRIDEIVRWRREHQPGGANAGSVFTNPPGDSAGRLIEACGLKGHRVGGAVVSEKHANFFQADPGATAADVAGLVAEVQARVEESTGIRLEPELTLVGFG